MAQALEAYDLISSCQQLASDVKQARATGFDGTEAFETVSGGASGRDGAYGFEQQAAPVSSFDSLGLGELQSALNSSAQQQQQLFAPAPFSADPFMTVRNFLNPPPLLPPLLLLN